VLRSIAIGVLGLTTVLSACTVQINTGTGTTQDTTPPDTTVTTVPGADTTSSTTEHAGAPLQDVRGAIVRVVAGSLTDPPGVSGTTEPVTTSATGFFIDASGRIITTNEAVAGADQIDVYLTDDPTPHVATVLTTDECHDLAVIDVDDTDHTVLPLTSEQLTAGEHVTVGGYPGRTAVYTVTDGTITTTGESRGSLIGLYAPAWVGESGAPVLTEDGHVGAMTVSAGDEGTSAVPFSVLGDSLSELAEASIDGGFLSIGLNIVSYHDPTGMVAPDGLWVRGVTANSAANEVGIIAGDVIVSIGERDMAGESGLAAYCLALEDFTPAKSLPIVIYRSDDGLFYEGAVGGDTPLVANGQGWPNTTVAQTTTTTTTPKPLPPATTTTLPAFGPPPGDDLGAFDWIKTTGFYLLPVDETYPAYVAVRDTHDVIGSVKPDEWGLELSVDATPIYGSSDGPYGTGVQLYVIGTDRIEEYTSEWTTPGYQIGIAHKTPYDSWSPEMWVRSRDWSDRCVEGGIGVYDNGTYDGLYRFWHHCETDYADAVKLDIAAWNDDRSVITWMSGLMFSDADYDAFSKALSGRTLDVARLTSEGY